MKRIWLMVFVVSSGVLMAGLWIPLKALVAQELLAMAWAESQARQTEVRPWPWADTWPVARLSLPEQAQSMIVLSGSHGESLAFGPGWFYGYQNGSGPVVLAGHRDTHFKPLQRLQPGHLVQLQSRDGRWRDFRVVSSRVIDARRHQLNPGQLAPDSLILVTCYPFDGMTSGGPLRYVVEARATRPEQRNGAAVSARKLLPIDTVAGL
ncbi:class GN sortase [Marinobacter salinisoli]|uniref:Class GN sortase n=1 Tax=Marinobacter salinisoli TaxID=2769486 RepID=A0ABX7MSK2_9GAMM|nr:class GN sortase [Marinobacter salinisoli]QSP95347.1 class GN sortase [Marinobacter salinisoli]